jgi:hypothetical protein
VFRHTWERAEGRIVARTAAPHQGSGDTRFPTIFEFAVDIQTEHGEPFRSIVHTPVNAIDFEIPKVGDTVRVEVEVKSRKVRFDRSDPRLSIKAAKRERAENFEQVLAQPPGTGDNDLSAPGPEVPPDAASVLKAVLNQEDLTNVFVIDSNSDEAQQIKEKLRKALGGEGSASQPGDSGAPGKN